MIFAQIGWVAIFCVSHQKWLMEKPKFFKIKNLDLTKRFSRPLEQVSRFLANVLKDIRRNLETETHLPNKLCKY